MSTEHKLKKAIFSHIKITLPCSVRYCSFYVFFLYALTWHCKVKSAHLLLQNCCSLTWDYGSVLTHLPAGLWHAVIGDSNGNHSDIGDRRFFDKVCDISQPLTSLAGLGWQANTYRLAFLEQLTQQLKVGRERTTNIQTDMVLLVNHSNHHYYSKIII